MFRSQYVVERVVCYLYLSKILSSGLLCILQRRVSQMISFDYYQLLSFTRYIINGVYMYISTSLFYSLRATQTIATTIVVRENSSLLKKEILTFRKILQGVRRFLCVGVFGFTSNQIFRKKG